MSDTTISFQRLDIYLAAKAMTECVHRARISDEVLRDQARRASKSAFLQIAEGLPNDSVPMRRKYFICARNSACETAAAIDLASALGCIGAEDAHRIALLAKSIAMMLRAMIR